MNYYMPTRLYTGDGCISLHQDALSALGSACLIITDKTAAKASGALDDVEQALAACGITSQLWDGVTENPPVASCIEAGKIAAAGGAQFVVGIGGGSALDAAKAIAVFAANPTLDEDAFYAFSWDNKPLPIVCVGTTAGTGSEVTKVSVLTDSKHRKHSIHDDRLYATLSFGDSRHTHSCPQGVTLSCGVDVIAHAVESYFSRKADEISRAFAVRAIRLAAPPLQTAAAGSELSSAQREQLYEASILGGLAINTTGTCFPHNVGYYLTETYGIPHGFASATFLPSMLACVWAYDPAYSDAFCSEIGMSDLELADLVTRCLPAIDIRMSDDEIAQALPRWKMNGSVMNTRATVTMHDIHKMLRTLFT